MEIILENAPSTTSKQIIKTNNRANLKYNIELPGSIINDGPSRSAVDAKRLTQGIAAIAAQRKASQHHKELMQELGQYNSSEQSDYNYNQNTLTPSRLARHDQAFNNTNSNEENIYYEKKNSFMTDGSYKVAKKQVKIKDIVEFKLPDESVYPNEDENNLVGLKIFLLKNKKIIN